MLKTLEELHIPVDYIAGTSMGAIVGGLYATGMSADELRAALLSVDWADALSDSPRRQDLSFRRKEDDKRYLFDLEGGLRKGKLHFPSGLRTGQKLGFLLQQLTFRASGTYDFDHLPIPFRAVATDIQTGDPVVLDHGSLVTAMRASMAIPAVFTAVELEGRTLVDGGISNNVPVDVARAMGADIVIAVDLRQPETEEEIASYLQVVGQLNRFLTRKNMEARLAQAEVVVHPDVTGHTTMGFDKVAELYERGYEQARSQAQELQRLAVPAEDYARHRQRQLREPAPAPVVHFVRFEGLQRVDERLLRPLVRVALGKPLDFAVLSGDLLRIYGLSYFQQVSFSLSREDGQLGLIISVLEKPWGPHYVRAGLFGSSDVGVGGAQNSLLLNHTSAPLNARGGEWRNDLRLGSESGVFTEFYQPLSFRGDWFVAPRAQVRLFELGVFASGQEIANLDVRLSEVAVDIGRQFGSYAEARVGLAYEYANLDVRTGSVEVADDHIGLGGVTTRWSLDRLDNVNVPRDGAYLGLSGFQALESLGADLEFTRLELVAGDFERRGRGVFFGALEGGVSPGSELPIYAQFTVGGLLSLSGFAETELLGEEYGVARAGYYRQVGESSFFLGGWLEAGNVWSSGDSIDFDDLITTVTAAVLWDSVLGPVIVAYGRAETGDDKVYFSIGRTL